MRSRHTARIATGVLLALLGAPALAGQDGFMRFSGSTCPFPTAVVVVVQILNPDGTWGTVYVPPVIIPPLCPPSVKRDLIQAALQSVFTADNVTDVGQDGLRLHLDSGRPMRLFFNPGATGENPDYVLCEALDLGVIAYVGPFDPYDYGDQPAVFTAGIVTDVGELSVQVSASELNFQTDGPIICQALFQRLAPHAPQYGAQINYAGDRLEVYFDPAYTVQPGGIIFGTTSSGQGASGGVQSDPPLLTGDLNCDGVVAFGDINPFVLALGSPDAYAAAYPGCDILAADINGDGVVDFRDINAFVALLTGG